MRAQKTDRKGDMGFKYNRNDMDINSKGVQPARGRDLAAGGAPQPSLQGNLRAAVCGPRSALTGKGQGVFRLDKSTPMQDFVEQAEEYVLESHKAARKLGKGANVQPAWWVLWQGLSVIGGRSNRRRSATQRGLRSTLPGQLRGHR